MPRCEQCQRDFETEEGLAQHNRDKHGIGRVTKHEMKEMKKQEREEKKMDEISRAKRSKAIKTIGVAAVVIVLIAVIGYALSTISLKPPASAAYNLAGIPNSFVHWHADVDVVICGEDKRLPEATGGSLLGTHRMHTHDHAANIQSLPGSDGNGVIHTEGAIPQAPQEHTLERFMKNIGIRFDNETIMDKRNGDACNGTPGTVKVFLNEQPLDDFLAYLPRDRDVIRIEFS